MRAKLITEKFKEKTDPINDMGIGIPEYSVVTFDYNADGREVYEQFESALSHLGIEMNIDPASEDTDTYVFILTKKEISDKQLDMISKEINHEEFDDEE